MLETLIEALGALSQDELSQLNRAVVSQIKQTRSAASANAIVGLRTGQNVRISVPGRASKYNGLEGPIVDVRRTKVVVQTIFGRVVVPASCAVSV